LQGDAEPDAGPKQASDAVAWALACASLGNNHLWQDLCLPSRGELSALIGRWFPRLAARNTQNMKWKKFFYKQLCERADLVICRSPSCGVCADYPQCFGPEDAAR
ncbi:MAG: nitrogen fixation protein NifQ, partial [Polaromonas sp.]